MPTGSTFEIALLEHYGYPVLEEYLINYNGLQISRDEDTSEITRIFTGSVENIVAGAFNFLSNEDRLSSKAKISTVIQYLEEPEIREILSKELTDEVLQRLKQTNWGGQAKSPTSL